VANPSSYLKIETSGPMKMQVNPLTTEKLNGGYVSTRVVKIPKVREYHNEQIECIETWFEESKPLFKQIVKKEIKVEHPPTELKLEFNDENSELILGENRVGCMVIGGYPAVKNDQIEIFIDGKSLQNKIEIDAFLNVAYVNFDFTKRHQNKKISCVLTHPALKKPLETSQKMKVTYGPSSILIKLANREYGVSEEVLFTAKTDASHPAASLTCVKKLFNGETFELNEINKTLTAAEPYGSITTASFSFITSNLDDDSEIICTTLDKKVASVKRISVLTKPVFLENRVFTVKEGDTFQIPVDMVIRSNPQVKDVQWRREPSSPKLQISEENGKQNFVLEHVSSEMTGEYSIQAEGISGSIEIYVLTAPSISISGLENVLVGENLNLLCEVSGEPSPRVSWEKDGALISDYKIIQIENITRENAGQYKCIAENSHSTVGKSIFVDVAHLPIISAGSDKIVFSKDLSLKISCEIFAYPEVEAVVFTNPLGTEFIGQKLENEWSHFIDIRNTGKSELFGSWTCHAKNRIGVASETFDILQAGKPEKISSLRLTNQTESSVVLRWDAGFHNGFDQIFEIKLRSLSGEISEFSTYNNYVTFLNLTLIDEYIATVVGSNLKGKSLPVEINFSLQGYQTANVPTIYIYLICFTFLTLAIIITVIICNRKKELIYQTKSKFTFK
jgi:hypothetical protein